VVGITFALYSEPTGGAALWLETQNITADSNGHYVALLGSTKPDGLPTDVFTSEQARWVGVQISGQAEQPRVLLVSAPYALKAGDAETLGGLPPSAFMLANGSQGAASTAKGASAPAAAGAQKNSVPPANPAVTGKGVVDYIPMWDTTSDIVDSIIFQKSSEIGINTTTPAATLDVNGKTDIRDTLTLYPKSTDNTLAVNGTAFKIDSTGKVTFISGQTFPGTGTITGITTASGSGLSGGGTTGTLSLKVPSAGITNTMLQNSKITLNANAAGGITTPGAMTLGSTYIIGLKTCSANQVLQYVGTAWTCSNAGTGTITGVTAGTDLKGGGTSGTVTLNLDTTKVPQLNSANSFSGNQTIAGQLTVTNTSGSNTAVVGNGANYGVYGSGSTGVEGRTTSSTGVGVIGYSNGSGSGVYGSNTVGNGVVGNTFSLAGTGVQGITAGFLSKTGSGYNNVNWSSGVWADNSNTTTSGRQALLATADDASSIEAVNNSPSGFPTISAVQNAAGSNAILAYSNSGTAIFAVSNTGTPLAWINGSSLNNDQNGSIELGGNNTIANTSGKTPYVDFHYGTGAVQDYNARLINDLDGQLSVKFNPSQGFGVLNVNGRIIASNGFNGQCLQVNVFDNTGTNSCNMDLAEAYASAQQTEPGDLVSLVPGAEATVRKSKVRYEALLLGVVSSNPGLVFDNGQTHLAGNNSQLITKDKTVIALAGRVPIKISMENGSIRVGDPLTSSSKSGVAMKARSGGKIIGYALEPANQPGKVLGFIQPGYYAAPEMERLRRENVVLRKQLKDLISQVETIRTELDRTPLRADFQTAATSAKR
jgi:hypothetical protein